MSANPDGIAASSSTRNPAAGSMEPLRQEGVRQGKQRPSSAAAAPSAPVAAASPRAVVGSASPCSSSLRDIHNGSPFAADGPGLAGRGCDVLGLQGPTAGALPARAAAVSHAAPHDGSRSPRDYQHAQGSNSRDGLQAAPAEDPHALSALHGGAPVDLPRRGREAGLSASCAPAATAVATPTSSADGGATGGGYGYGGGASVRRFKGVSLYRRTGRYEAHIWHEGRWGRGYAVHMPAAAVYLC